MMNISQMQKGSALVESILIVGVLTIFMVGIPMIGSMIDLKQTTIQASRYSAWEKTVNVDVEHAGEHIDARFFQDASAPISSSLNSGLNPNSLWGELPPPDATPASDAAPTNAGNAPGGQTGPQLFQEARVTIAGAPAVVSGEDERGGMKGDLYSPVATVVTKLGSFISPDGWDEGSPVSNGLVRSVVQTQIEANTFFTSGMTLTESTSIFVDGWSAGDDDTIRERVHGFVPTNRLEKVGDFISRVKFIPMLNDLEHLEKAFGCVKNNIVPGKTYASGLTSYNESTGDNC